MSLITRFYVMRAVKMFYFVELLHNRNYGFSALVIGCYFLFTTITVRSLVTILWRSYDKFTTKLCRFY